MALVKCVECNKEISSSVKVCPHCGKKDPTISAKHKLIGFIIFVFVVIFLQTFCTDKNGKHEESKNVKSSTIVKKQNIDTLDKEKDLYEKVKKIPASDLEKNRDGYKQLLELNPNNKVYNDKYNHYGKLIENKNAENETAIVKQSQNFVRELIKEGAISVDNNSFRVYVDPRFWNMMDYSKKEAFCFVVQKSYPRHSIVDKFSGKNLAELNILGEIKIVE